MRLSNFVRSALASAVIAMLTGCSFWPLAPPAAAPLVSQPRSDVPFTITEPDIYQTEIVITASASERRIFTARNGTLRVIRYDNGSPNETWVLTTDADYVVSAAIRSYAKRPAGGSFGDEGLATRLLNIRPHAEFDDLGIIDAIEVQVVEDLLLLLGHHFQRGVHANAMKRRAAIVERNGRRQSLLLLCLDVGLGRRSRLGRCDDFVLGAGHGRPNDDGEQQCVR